MRKRLTALLLIVSLLTSLFTSEMAERTSVTITGPGGIWPE